MNGIVAIIVYVFIVDFPDNGHKAWNFLNEQECAFILWRVNKDRGDADPEPFKLKTFLQPALDPKIWAFALIALYVII